MNSSEEQLIKAKGNVPESFAGSQMLWYISGGFTLNLSKTERWTAQSNKGKEGGTKWEHIWEMSVF